MRDKFREYHKFAPNGYKRLLQECVFVFDANTLLNMYRYSRETVDSYMKVLKQLREKGQIWIPYQVGYEFYENRIGVITSYKKSYDEILDIIKKTKNELDSKYKDHPFLDMKKIGDEMSKHEKTIESIIGEAKRSHPDWMDKDDVLSQIADIFDGYVGDAYSIERLEQVYQEGGKRYEKKIPPGFKDSNKPDERKYGDLVIWYQIIEKAQEIKKPIVFISGDVKEDWWLKQDGERIMPLPALKREMLKKADVDFHIYTADKFLELFSKDTAKVSSNTIEEVRKVRELEEKKMMLEQEREMDMLKERMRYSDDDISTPSIDSFELYVLTRNLRMLTDLVNALHFNDEKSANRTQIIMHKLIGTTEAIKERGLSTFRIRRTQLYLDELESTLSAAIQGEYVNTFGARKVISSLNDAREYTRRFL